MFDYSSSTLILGGGDGEPEISSKENPLFDQSAPVIYFRDYRRPVTFVFQKTPQGKYNADECHTKLF